jgi:hypothetical protein
MAAAENPLNVKDSARDPGSEITPRKKKTKCDFSRAGFGKADPGRRCASLGPARPSDRLRCHRPSACGSEPERYGGR